MLDHPAVISVVLLVVVAVLWLDAPRQARRLAARTPTPLRPPTQAGRQALERELCLRLRLAATGSGLGVVVVAVPLVLRDIADDGPESLTVVATVLASTVVTGVVAEAVAVLRRTPRPDGGPRTAALVPRSAHVSPAEPVAEGALALVAALALALGVSLVARDVEDAAGSVASAVGALVVIAVCVLVRARFVRRPVTARDADELAVDAAAGAASTDRFTENLVASGGVLTLASLLIPAVLDPGTGRVLAVVLGLATLTIMVVLVVTRSQQRAKVRA